MSDPNALLSTLSQSSAAMVAIIGGFLVSKLIAISTEKEALKRQLKSARQRLKHVKPAYESAYSYRLDNSRETFAGWIIDDLVKAGLDPVNYEEISSKNIPRGSSLQEMLPYAIALHKRVIKAHRGILPLLEGTYSDSTLYLDDLKSRGLKVTEADEWIYQEVFHALKSELPEEPAQTIMGMALTKRSNLLAGFPMATLKPAWSHEVDARRLDDSIREEQELKEQLSTIEGEINRLNHDLAKLGKPVGVIPAVWILSLLSLLGIVLPVIVMSLDLPQLTPTLKGILISSFIGGLIAVLGYIVWYLKKIN